MNEIIETSTGKTVDLTGLSATEKAMSLMLQLVDPDHYNGGYPSSCLIGMPIVKIYGNSSDCVRKFAETTGVEKNVVNDIFGTAWESKYEHDYEAALEMAMHKMWDWSGGKYAD